MGRINLVLLPIFFIAMQYASACLWASSDLASDIKGLLGFISGLAISITTVILYIITLNDIEGE